MQSIEYNEESQIYDIQVECQKQNKQIILSKVSVHIWSKGTKEVDKFTKQAMDIQGMTTKRLYYTNYYHQES